MSTRAVRRILIVEDDKTLAYFLAQSLMREEQDFEVVAVGSAEEALRAVEQGRYDLLIADVMLPGSNGLDLLETARRRFPWVRAIVITAAGSNDVRERAYRLGAYAYLEKPFLFAKLKSLVLQVLGAAGRAPRP